MTPLERCKLPTQIDALVAFTLEHDRCLRSKIDELSAQYESLRAQVAMLQRMQYGQKSEKMDALGQADLFTLPVIVPMPKQAVEQISYERKKSAGRPKLPDSLPTELVVHDLTADQRASVQPESLCQIGEEKREYLDFVPAKLTKIVHVLPTYAALTVAGEKTVLTAELPIECAPPLPRTNASSKLLTQIIIAKYQDHLPLYRQESIFARHGHRIARQTLCDWILGATQLLEPLYLGLKAYVLACQKIHTDDTILPLIDPDGNKTAKARAWVYAGASEGQPTAVVYEFTEDRKGSHPIAFLDGYEGYLQADAYGGYDKIYAARHIIDGEPKPAVIEVACWAHARRKFFDIYTNEPRPKQGQVPPPPSIASLALDWIHALYAREKWAKDHSLSPAAKLRLRQKQSRRLLAHFRVWLERAGTALLPQSPTAKAIAYALSNWNALRQYCEHSVLDIDNNAAERAMRPLTLGRKNWLFAGSKNGGQAAAIAYSLIETAKANGLDPHAYLSHALAHIQGTKVTALDTLLPLNFERAKGAAEGLTITATTRPKARFYRRRQRHTLV